MNGSYPPASVFTVQTVFFLPESSSDGYEKEPCKDTATSTGKKFCTHSGLDQLWSHIIKGYLSGEGQKKPRIYLEDTNDWKDQGLATLFKQHFVWLLCWKINIPFPTTFLFQHPRLLISKCKLILSCVQTKHQPSVFTYLRFPLCIYFCFLFLSAGERPALLWGLFGRHATWWILIWSENSHCHFQQK